MDELLLDSTYLLPIFRIGLELSSFESTFTELPIRYAVKYNPVSLIETKWVIIKRCKEMKDGEREETLRNYRKGLISLQRDPALLSTNLTNGVIEELSDSLLTKYHIRDYFDRQIYSTAAYLRCVLLTEDKTLHDLFDKAVSADLVRPSRVLRWKDL